VNQNRFQVEFKNLELFDIIQTCLDVAYTFCMSKKNHIHTCNKGIIFLLDVIISGGQFGLVIN
jgi:hypothetical protein